MASNKEAGGKKVNPRGRSAQEKKSVRPDTDTDRRPSLNREDLGRQVEEYLSSIKQELSSNLDPNVKVEQSRIQELLDSYRKLVQVYNRRKEIEDKISGKKEFVVPEIYSVLYPELYNDQREKEKEKLRKSLVKSKPSSDSCVPRNFRLQTKIDLQDPRQKEKDRFVRLVASAPSAFLQGPTRRVTPRKVPLSSASTSKVRRDDPRELEKERLAKILSTSEEGNSGLRKRTASTSALKKSSSAPSCSSRSAPVPSTAVPKASSSAQPKKEPARAPPFRNNKPPDNVVKNGMVRRDVAKRFVPNQPDKQQERRKKLLELKNKEYQEYLDKLQGRLPKVDKCVLARESSLLDLSSSNSSPRSMKSVATQTDSGAQVIITPPISPHSPTYSTEMAVGNDQSMLFPMAQKEPFITSPRAKLIKDLHGVSPCLPGASPLLTLPDHAVNDEKKKRSAYAEALKQQIEQKKRLEEEKRRKELEEDEYIEKKAREQQERLKQEWEREQSLRQDWLMQKEAQEETVRQRMVELEIEAKELKKRERFRKGTLSPDTLGRHVLSPREVEQLLPQAMRDSMMSSIIMDNNKPRPKTLHIENNNNHLLTTSTYQNDFATQESRLNDVVNNNEKQVETSAAEVESPQPTNQLEPTTDVDTPVADDDVLGGETRERPTSPVLPAIQTDSILRRSLYSSPRLQLIQGENDKEEILRGDKILTQLGVFRRELELEQERLQQRLYEQAST